MSLPWPLHPTAAALLASCAERPPALVRHRDVYAITADEWTEYSRRDPRVKALELIRDEAFATATGLGAIAVATMTVDRAINETIAAMGTAGRAVAA